MRLLLNLVQICLNLPWWGGLAVLAGLVAFGYGLVWYAGRKFDKIVRDTVMTMGAVFKDAEATIHSVTAAPRPTEPSPYDLPEDDENYAEELDGTLWDEEGVNFYWIDATIAPADPEAAWDPTALAVVPADYVPDDPTDACIDMGGLHSAEIFTGGTFRPFTEEQVHGPQRLRMLFAIDEKQTSVKFASGVHYFGRVELPKSSAKSPQLVSQR
jgi:hypothetical protein